MSDAVCFSVYGVCLTPDELRVRLKASEDDALWDAYYEALARLNDEDATKFEFHDTFDGKFIYCGVAPDSMKDDETKAHFQTRVERVLLKLLGGPLRYAYYVEAY